MHTVSTLCQTIYRCQTAQNKTPLPFDGGRRCCSQTLLFHTVCVGSATLTTVVVVIAGIGPFLYAAMHVWCLDNFSHRLTVRVGFIKWKCFHFLLFLQAADFFCVVVVLSFFCTIAVRVVCKTTISKKDVTYNLHTFKDFFFKLIIKIDF